MSNTKRPMIGILPSHVDIEIKTSQSYLNAIWRAGGFGVPLGYTEDAARLCEYAERMDGFLFSGGVDIDPSYYGEERQTDSLQIDEPRDRFEVAAFRHIYATRKPILGICRGIQVLNVFLGGTLYQHMDGHMQDTPGCRRDQHVIVVPGGLLHQITGAEELMTNSFHHQSVKALAPCLLADAVSDDGYIEAFHHPAHPFLLGLQFHPEMYHDQPDDTHGLHIFRAFIDACG